MFLVFLGFLWARGVGFLAEKEVLKWVEVGRVDLKRWFEVMEEPAGLSVSCMMIFGDE